MPEYNEIKRLCTELFQQGKIRVSNSPYAAPIVIVRKPDGPVRVCIDHRAINERTFRDSFPLPRIDDLIDKLREALVLHILIYDQRIIKYECRTMTHRTIRLRQ